MSEDQSASSSTDKDEPLISEPCRKHECKSHVFPLEFLEKLQINTNVLCPQCGSEFAQESALNLHIEKVHHLKVQVNTVLLYLFGHS
jgi:predicted Zn-ribbon and HTH transcriptional regulator